MANSILIVTMIVCWGIGCFFYKIANTHVHPIVVSTVVTCLYLILTPVAWLFIKFDHKLNIIGALTSAAGGLFVCIASLAYFAALQKGAAGEVTILSSMYPVLTMILSVIFLGEQLTPPKIVGILFAGASFYFLTK